MVILFLIEILSFGFPTLFSRLVLFFVFFSAIAILVISQKFFSKNKNFQILIFSIIFIISLIFLLRRFNVISPSYIQALIVSERYAFVENFGETGFITFDSSHSFIFQHPLLIRTLLDVTNLSIVSVTIVTLVLHAALVAFAGTIFYKMLSTNFENETGLIKHVLTPLLSFFEKIDFSVF